jgi:hypothetical protein
VLAHLAQFAQAFEGDHAQIGQDANRVQVVRVEVEVEQIFGHVLVVKFGHRLAEKVVQVSQRVRFAEKQGVYGLKTIETLEIDQIDQVDYFQIGQIAEVIVRSLF